MSNTTIVQHNSIPLSKIDCYGSHLGSFHGAKGRVISFLHYNILRNQKELARFYIQWVQQPTVKELPDSLPEGWEDFFKHINSLKTVNNLNFSKANSEHLRQIIVAFNKNEETLKSVFTHYNELVNASPYFNIEAFIVATNKILVKNGADKQMTRESIKATMDAHLLELSQLEPMLGASLYDGMVWEIACAFWSYRYEAIPVINVCLNALTGSMLFSGFWGFFVASFFADLSVAVIGAGLKGLYQTHSLQGALNTIIDGWKQRVEDDNSFHPLFEFVISSTYIAASWLYLDKLQQAAKAGDYLHTLMQWGVKGYVLRYSTLHFAFAWKADLHRGKFFSLNALMALFFGAIRGAIKNPLADASLEMQKTYKLSQGLSLLGYRCYLIGNAYLNFWMKSVPQTIIRSPELLINCLWIAKDAWEAVITNFSSIVMQLIMHFPNLSEKNRKTVLMSALIVAILAYYNPETFYSYINLGNYSVV